MTVSDFRDLLFFWEDPTDAPPGGTTALADVVASIGAMDDRARSHFVELARNQYASQEGIRISIAARAASLVVFVGVVATGTTVIVGSVDTTDTPLLVATVILGGILLYACVAVAWLAVKAQQVQAWTTPVIRPAGHVHLKSLEVQEAAEFHVAWERNRGPQRRLVAFLRDAQLWARIAVFALVTLAGVSVALSTTGRAHGATSPRASDIASPSLPPREASPSALPRESPVAPTSGPGQSSMPPSISPT